MFQGNETCRFTNNPFYGTYFENVSQEKSHSFLPSISSLLKQAPHPSIFSSIFHQGKTASNPNTQVPQFKNAVCPMFFKEYLNPNFRINKMISYTRLVENVFCLSKNENWLFTHDPPGKLFPRFLSSPLRQTEITYCPSQDRLFCENLFLASAEKGRERKPWKFIVLKIYSVIGSLNCFCCCKSKKLPNFLIKLYLCFRFYCKFI